MVRLQDHESLQHMDAEALQQLSISSLDQRLGAFSADRLHLELLVGKSTEHPLADLGVYLDTLPHVHGSIR